MRVMSGSDPNPFSANPKSSPLQPGDSVWTIGPTSKLEALLANRVAQFNSYSCSAAALATVVNAILTLGQPAAAGQDRRHLSQHEILTRVDLHHWRERVSEAGYMGLHGMPLQQFGDVVRAALTACGIVFQRVDTVHIHPRLEDPASRKRCLRRALRDLAETPHVFLIAHFTQGEYFGHWYGGHISPVAAFDRAAERVLVLDVDPECPAPYWVSLDRFFNGLVGRSKVIGTPGGGYVEIRLTRAKN
jgi:hypothetical protein